MMKRTVVLNVVGLTPKLLGAYTPRLQKWASQSKVVSIQPMLPAVTCSVQATYLTGKYPSDHGIVANGWYFRDECEIKFWRQSNHLVQSPKIWDMARTIDSDFTCANLFWWYNMYSSADFEVTPRPMYPADGRKLPDIYTKPAFIRSQLQQTLGQFPLFQFWGPATSIASTQWIANAAKWVEEHYHPTLSLVYLPHLDYCCQKIGTNLNQIATELHEIDSVCGDLIDYYKARDIQVILLSEYGITPVSQPVHLNRILREHGFLAVREELGRELLDAGASQAFAVADHQFAHIYVNHPDILPKVKAILEKVDGVAEVLDAAGKRLHQLDHPRSGELVAIARPDAWFTYYYWLEDKHAPDYARTVDIHRKPGYDPLELLIDPTIKQPQLKIASTLLKKQLGFRTLMEVIPLDAALIRGSHGHLTSSLADSPLFITQQPELVQHDVIQAIDVCGLILNHLCQNQAVSIPNH